MREEAAQEFLRRSGWGGAKVTPLQGDASTRHYARLSANGRHALLMDQPQGAEAPMASEQASEAERRALGYNAMARLAGADTGRFQAVAEHLNARGLAAPCVHAADHPSGFVILEDFGDRLFADVLADGASEEELYEAAADVLAKLHAQPAPRELAPGIPLFAYDETALLAETDLLTEWFLPLALGRPASEVEHSEHRALWRTALDTIADHGKVLVHRDFHAQNLMWMPERGGLGRVGLIDFQDAVAGSRAYDLISLIEDARRDVSPALAEHATRHYLAAMAAQGTPLDETRFRMEMAVMAAQRNAKIVGIFARLYRRDHKPRYLALLPRVWGYLERDLNHPALADLRAWYDQDDSQRTTPSPGGKGTSLSNVTRAMIMAAGFGTRMRPLTDDRPKPLVTVRGRTLLDHALDRLVVAGVKMVVINLHYRAQQVMDHLKTRRDIEIRYSLEEEILGTGGGVVKALPLFEGESFFILNSDSVWVEGYVAPLMAMQRFWQPDRMDGLLLLAAMTTAMGYEGRGDFLLDVNGHIARVPERTSSPFAYPGVQIVHPRLFAGAPDGSFSTNLMWDRAIAKGRLYGMRLEGVWIHVGTPEAREDAERYLARLMPA